MNIHFDLVNFFYGRNQLIFLLWRSLRSRPLKLLIAHSRIYGFYGLDDAVIHLTKLNGHCRTMKFSREIGESLQMSNDGLQGLGSWCIIELEECRLYDTISPLIIIGWHQGNFPNKILEYFYNVKFLKTSQNSI